MTLLILHFPSLRLLWSVSHAATCDLVSDLQRDEEPPSLERATRVGLQREEELDIEYHLTPKALLNAIPGLSTVHHYAIHQRFPSVKALGNASREELCDILGLALGTNIYDFFNHSLFAT